MSYNLHGPIEQTIAELCHLDTLNVRNDKIYDGARFLTLDQSMHQIGDKRWHELLLVFRFEKAEETWKILFVTRVSCSPRIQNLRGK